MCELGAGCALPSLAVRVHFLFLFLLYFFSFEGSSCANWMQSRLTVARCKCSFFSFFFGFVRRACASWVPSLTVSVDVNAKQMLYFLVYCLPKQAALYSDAAHILRV